MLTTTQYRPKDIFFYADEQFRGPSEPILVKAGSGALEAGQVMGLITASSKWAPYNDAHSDGTEVARLILQRYVDASGASDVNGLGSLGGWYRESTLVGLDAAAKIDLGAKSFWNGALYVGGVVAMNGDLAVTGLATLAGGLAFTPTTPPDSAYTVLTTDDVVLFPSAAAPRTITLPAAATFGLGRVLKIATINANTQNITLDGDAAETINGAATLVMSAANQVVSLMAIAGGWRIV